MNEIEKAIESLTKRLWQVPKAYEDFVNGVLLVVKKEGLDAMNSLSKFLQKHDNATIDDVSEFVFDEISPVEKNSKEGELNG